MTCGDVDQHLDAFVDSELPPPMLLEVARHAAGCSACETAIRQLETIRRMLAETVRADVADLDLSGVWPRVSTQINGSRARRTWQRRLRTVPAWGAVLAAAASAVFFVRVARHEPGRLASTQPQQIASRPQARTPQNLAYIDRLAGKDVSIRREPKAGTTLIWVNYTAGDGTR